MTTLIQHYITAMQKHHTISNVNSMVKNIDKLLSNLRLSIVKEILNFCDTVNADIPATERPDFCRNCKYGVLCDAINSQLNELKTIDFLFKKEI